MSPSASMALAADDDDDTPSSKWLFISVQPSAE
jgi:hypothetical protein